MSSIRTLMPLAAAGLASLVSADSATCSGSLPASCQNSTAVSNTCCFISAGLLAQTQFWDTDPVTGPDDYCDGTYPESCDSSRDYTDISGILTDAGATDTLSYMQKYWQDISGSDESFWEHEWSKHGTCVSTLEPSCYSGYQDEQEAVDYFNRVVSLFKTLPTYKWLSDAGITPGSGSVSRSDILDALQGPFGAEVYIDCEDGALNQVWYYFNVQGSLQDGTFTAVDTPSYGSCGTTVTYNPKN